MREWIGNYKLYYQVHYSYKDETIVRQTDLGKCLGVDEAAAKAVNFLNSCDDEVWPMYLLDGFGNKIKA